MNNPSGRVAPAPSGELELHGHLFISHSVYMGNEWDLGELTQAHEEEHSPEHVHLIKHPHTHSAAPEEEWSWE